MKSRAKHRSSPHDPIAVVDIGSNSGRVMVFRPEAGGHLHVLAGSRAALRLARDLDRTGRIPQEALERAFDALRDFRAIALGSGVRRFEAAGLKTNDALFGLFETGAMDEAAWLKITERLPEGISEVYCHPATATKGVLAAEMPDYRHADELAAQLEALRRLVPHLEVIRIPGAGHYPMHQARNEVLAPAIRFIRSLTGASTGTSSSPPSPR